MEAKLKNGAAKTRTCALRQLPKASCNYAIALCCADRADSRVLRRGGLRLGPTPSRPARVFLTSRAKVDVSSGPGWGPVDCDDGNSAANGPDASSNCCVGRGKPGRVGSDKREGATAGRGMAPPEFGAFASRQGGGRPALERRPPSRFFLGAFFRTANQYGNYAYMGKWPGERRKQV